MDRYQETIDRTAIVKRFIVPAPGGLYDDPIHGLGRRIEVSAEDLGLVAEGRACGKCLAVWESPVLTVCPVCRQERSVGDILDKVAEFEQYKSYVQGEMENPERTEVTKPHEFVEAISRAHGVKPSYDRGIERR